MSIPHYKHMTNEMKEVADFTLNEERLKDEFLFCHQMYLKAEKAGDIGLPHTTEDGEPVIQAARLVMYKLSEYWEVRRDAIKEFLPREWVEEQGVSSYKFKR